MPDRTRVFINDAEIAVARLVARAARPHQRDGDEAEPLQGVREMWVVLCGGQRHHPQDGREPGRGGQPPPELANLPPDFWDGPELVMPVAKEVIPLRVDEDVLALVSQSRHALPDAHERRVAVLHDPGSQAPHHEGAPQPEAAA